jgi:DNA-binding MarR family transcriptional regulator
MRWRAQVDRTVAAYGLTHATYSALTSIYDENHHGASPSQRELADLTGLETVYISKLVSSLEGNGFVTRSPHPDDSRAVQLDLTDSGRAAIEPAIEAVRDLHEELLAPLGGPRSARSRQLKAALQDLLDHP